MNKFTRLTELYSIGGFKEIKRGIRDWLLLSVDRDIVSVFKNTVTLSGSVQIS